MHAATACSTLVVMRTAPCLNVLTCMRQTVLKGDIEKLQAWGVAAHRERDALAKELAAMKGTSPNGAQDTAKQELERQLSESRGEVQELRDEMERIAAAAEQAQRLELEALASGGGNADEPLSPREKDLKDTIGRLRAESLDAREKEAQSNEAKAVAEKVSTTNSHDAGLRGCWAQEKEEAVGEAQEKKREVDDLRGMRTLLLGVNEDMEVPRRQQPYWLWASVQHPDAGAAERCQGADQGAQRGADKGGQRRT